MPASETRAARERPETAPAGPRKGRDWVRLVAGVLLVLALLDLAFPPPIHRAREVSTVITDREGRFLRAMPVEDGRWRLAVDLDAVDPELVRRVVAYEDRRFWWHPGVDPMALARAGWGWLSSGRAGSGASTITMQTARLLEPRPRTLGSKAIEMVRAIQLEWRLPKRQILELYLTMAPYGGNLEGVRSATRAFFGKEPVALTDAEMALLVALPQAPEARRPDLRPRAASAARAQVLARQARAGLLTPDAALEATADPLPRRLAFPVLAPHLTHRLGAGGSGRALIRSTLDAPLQARLEAIAARAVEGSDTGVSVAMLVVAIEGREVRAAVGSAGRSRPGGWIDMTRAIRSPGSTLKPFVYALAFDDGVARPDTRVRDMPRRFGTYAPENFDRGWHGEVRLREALVASLNLPAVATLDRVGPARFESALRAAGIALVLPDRATQDPGLALALGGVGMRLEDLAMLYAALGDDGMVRPLVTQTGPGAPAPSGPRHRLFGAEAARSVRDILATTPEPFGRLPSVLTRAAPAVAYKTGTSYGFRDAWAVGLTGGHVIAVWVGRPDGSPRPGATGRTAAAPILFQVADRVSALEARGGRDTLVAEAAPQMLAPALARLDPAREGPSIQFPVDGSRLALPALGASAPGVVLEARGGAGALTWYVDGLALAAQPTSRRTVWRPLAPGFYEIAAIDQAGQRSVARVRVSLDR